MSKKYTSIGGQALIEGIMMKGPKRTVIAVRNKEKEIEIVDMEEKHLKDKCAFFGLPIIRGVVNFVESMVTGYKAMMISADKSGYTDFEEEEDKKKRLEKINKKRAKKGEAPLEELNDSDKKNETFLNVLMAISSVLGVGLAIVLFMFLPRLAVDGISLIIGKELSVVIRSGIEQFIKLAIFVGYVALVSLMKDIHRVFEFHGAEHKAIFCYESGEELTVENVKKQSRFHPRCGTSFMLLMILVSFIVSILIQMIFPSVYDMKWIWVVAKILLIPIICGIGYEILKACGKYDNLLTKIISAPGLWMQRITTKEPDEEIIEVAIRSIIEVIPEDTNGELA